ncbi:MAG: T9SS type A sorting domain-containing protein [Bacteroidetes bacterium]|nr:T9SS type A sorting domain-containing protein [Bacteroidota bacterium]
MIENNNVSRTLPIVDVRDIVGIAVFRRGVLAGNVDVPYGAVVQNNTISGYVQTSTSEGFGIVAEGINHTVSGNNVSGCDVGIQRQSGHLPYPGDGDQSNLADTYFGRGNSPVTCGVTVTGNTLSNTIDTRDVPASVAGGAVQNQNTGNWYCSIQSAINAATAGDVLNVSSGTYNEQVLVNKLVTLNGGTPKPVINFTGTVSGKPTLFDVSVAGVTIDNFNFKVDMTKLNSAIIASATTMNNLTITDNDIEAIGSSGAATFGSYGNRNAISINYGGPTNYRIASGGVNNVLVTGNTVSGVVNDGFGQARFFRAAVATDESGGTYSGNTFQTINHDVVVRFGGNGNVNITNNNLNGGGVEISDMNAGAGVITISGNTFDATFANSSAPGTAVLRLKNNYNFKTTAVTGNTFSNHQWAISQENYNTVTVDNNGFTPLAGSTTYHHIAVNTKSISTNSNAIVQVQINGVITNNTFNGSGTPGGTGLSFHNHDNDAANIGTFTIGGSGNENDFNAGIGTFIRLDDQTGTSSGSTFPAYTSLIGAGAGALTTMACWTLDVDIQENNFDVGSGLQLPSAMSGAGRTTLETALHHKPDNACLGNLIYFYPVHNITQNTYYLTINSAIAAANAKDVIEAADGSYNERVVIDKSLTLQGASESGVILDGTGLVGTGKGITINNGITNVTIKKLTVQDYAGSNGNADAGIYGIGGNNNLTVQNVSLLNNVGGSGFYANGPVNTVLIDSVTSTGHTVGARGIVIWNGLKENITIMDCHVYGNNCCGIELQDGQASGVTMTNNNVHDNGDNGIGIVGMQGPGENVVSGNTLVNNGRFGMEIKNPNGSGAATGAGRVVIENNNVSRTLPIVDARDIVGIAVFRRGVLAGNVDVPYGAVVQNNTISGYVQTSTSEGFGIVAEGINHTVSGNNVSGCDVGIQRQAGHLPYPGDGDQSNLADTYFGRGNSPVTCGVTVTGNTLSNTIDTRDVGTSNNAGTVTNTTSLEVFCSIQAAINDAQTLNGHTLTVSAGTYAENVIVNKSLSILGPNAAIDACSGSRVAEAIVVSAVADIDFAEIFHVAASNVTISGFTIDGDNTALTSGFTSTNGADIDAAEGVTVYETGINNLTVSDNIIQNLSYFGVTLYDYPAGVPSSGHVITNNKIQNLGTYDIASGIDYWGGGVLLYNNQYTAITNNCMSNVRLGVQTGNFSQANPGAPASQVISGNTIEARRTGIFHNLHYSSASPMTFSNNTIEALANANETRWDGIALSSLAVPSVSTNNTIDGNGITASNLSKGYEIWNVAAPITNSTITGGSVSGVDIGVFANNYDGYSSDAPDGSYATISGVTITPNITGVGVRIYDNALATSHAPVRLNLSGCTISGGLEGVKFEETQAGTVGGTINNNNISASGIGVNVNSMVTSVSNVFSVTNNTINITGQTAGGNPTSAVFLRQLTGTTAAAISGNTITGPFYGYLAYNLNTSPATDIDGGTISGVLQGVAFINIDPITFTAYAPSTATVKNVTMSGFTGNHPSLPNNNFHAGVYTFTSGSNTAATLNVTLRDLNIDGTGKTSPASAGIYPADFSTGAGVRQTIIVDSCIISNNLNRGISARGSNAVVDVNNCTLTNKGGDPFGAGGNDGFGVFSAQNAVLTLDNSYVTNPASVTAPYSVFALATGLGTPTLTATNNSLNNNGNANGLLANNFSGTLTATCNWWGTGSLATIATLVSGAVTYQPILISGTDADATMEGFQPGVGTCQTVLVVVNGVVTDETCTNLNNGAIDITASGGISPYTYAWSNGSFSEDQTGLDAGTYTVTVTDFYGNSGTNSFVVNPGVTATSWYADTDLDTYGDPMSTVLACVQPVGYVADNTDCNDGSAAVNPGATEICNGIDDDCDGLTDDADPSITGQSTWYADADGDSYGNLSVTTLACTQPIGYVANSTDCNDGNPAVNPGATEICNTIDDDCDGLTDDADPSISGQSTWYADADGDSYGNAAVTTLSCTQPVGYVFDNSDCNDASAAVNPGATEVCNGIDDDCDGDTDDDDQNVTGQATWYADADGDTYGDVNVSQLSCNQPLGYVANSTDCDDANAAVNPGATESCNGIDDDCNGLTDDNLVFTTYYNDFDGDGYGTGAGISLCSNPGAGYATLNGDCNDGNAAINPGATEVCNGIDDDCDGLTDDADPSITGQATWYADADGDTYGNNAVSVLACLQPMGYVANNTDCNDGNIAVNPGATEVCNTIDDDCDGLIDDADPSITGQATWYADADGDTYGNNAVSVLACFQPVGYVANNTDCNDGNIAVNPGATEVCNTIDDDCDGLIDDADPSITGQATWYADADGDTYGNNAVSVLACFQPMGYVANNTDCNDGNIAVNPGATEICNGIDDDCDGLTDDADPSITGQATWYADADGDTYGNNAVSVLACLQPMGYVANNTDCNDGNIAVNPGATEVCNTIDDDCDGLIDDADPSITGQATWYADADGDTYGNNAVSVLACFQPVGYVANNTDCNDGNAAVNPGATEVCNTIDDDCDGLIDDADPSITGQATWYADADGDTYGNNAVSVLACFQPMGYVANNTDCNDGNIAVNPGATEVCNTIDDDCDGLIDDADPSITGQATWYADADGDTYGNNAVSVLACFQPMGYVANNTDCNDGNIAVNPGATEVCNTIDDDCDGLIDDADPSITGQATWYADADGDTYGNNAVSVLACFQPMGYVANNTDCNDGNIAVNPGATEICNGIDDDCDGLTDDADPSVVGQGTYYTDGDNDGYGAGAPIVTCFQPGGTSLTNDDCNDGNPAVNPGATEICDSIDDDCDGLTDDADPSITGQPSWYTDADGDNYGTGAAILACIQPIGTVALNGDCNDADPAINPGATELCNGIDDNCNGLTDDGVAPLPTPGAITGIASACVPATFGSTTFSIAPVPGATGYAWTVPAGFTILFGQGTTTITVQWTNINIHNGIAGPLCVIATGPCTPSAPSCIGVGYQIATPVTPPSISGPGKVCPGDVAVYSISPVFRAMSYTWTVPAGMTINSGQGTNVINVSVNGGYTGGSMTVTASNACGTSPARSKAMSLNNPLTPGAISGQKFGLCNTTGVVFSIAPVVGATSYTWTASSGIAITGGQGTTSITVDVALLTGTGTLTVVAVNNCGNSPIRSVNIFGIPDRPQPITGATAVCTNALEPYSVPTVAGTSVYTWTMSSAGFVASGQGTKNIDVQWGAFPAAGQTLTVIASNACGNSAARSVTGIVVSTCPRLGDNTTSATNLVVFPNPATDRITVQFNSTDESNYRLRLTDVAGREVFVSEGKSSIGINTQLIGLDQLSGGVYFVEIQNQEGSQSIRLMVE